MIWYSEPFESKEDSISRYFHVDNEDSSIVRVYLYLSPITTPDHGPLTVIQRTESRKIYQKLRTNYEVSRNPALKGINMTDDKIIESYGKISPTPCFGEMGSLVMADTCNVYHKGGEPGAKSRRVLMVQYTSPYAIGFPLTKQSYSPWFEHFPKNKAVEKALFGKSHYNYKKHGLVSPDFSGETIGSEM